MTLQEILKTTKVSHKGDYSIEECKKSIIWDHKTFGTSYYTLLEKYVERANNDIFFNKAMVVACWEIINEK